MPTRRSSWLMNRTFWSSMQTRRFRPRPGAPAPRWSMPHSPSPRTWMRSVHKLNRRSSTQSVRRLGPVSPIPMPHFWTFYAEAARRANCPPRKRSAGRLHCSPSLAAIDAFSRSRIPIHHGFGLCWALSGKRLRSPSATTDHVRASLNPFSRFDFGVFAGLPSARSWQAKELRQ